MCRSGKIINCPKCKDYFACMAEQKEIKNERRSQKVCGRNGKSST